VDLKVTGCKSVDWIHLVQDEGLLSFHVVILQSYQWFNHITLHLKVNDYDIHLLLLQNKHIN
jgi:hypothetical protein